MASLSRLVAGVAHEINSPLAALKSNLELLTVTFGRLATTQGRAKEEARLFEHLVTVTHSSVLACARIVGVVRALSSFARLDESDYKFASINDCIRTDCPASGPRAEEASQDRSGTWRVARDFLLSGSAQ
jgi:signal transduction histidine kinase